MDWLLSLSQHAAHGLSFVSTLVVFTLLFGIMFIKTCTTFPTVGGTDFQRVSITIGNSFVDEMKMHVHLLLNMSFLGLLSFSFFNVWPLLMP